jgi:FkbM family methyltransferase
MSSKSYGQLYQDLIAINFFRLYPATHNRFLDIGAFDGIGFSNVRLLFEQGWSGICVEPVMKNYQKLESLYQGTNVITIRAAVTDYEGELKLNVATIPWAQDWGSDVSSSSSDVLKRWPDYNWETEIVPATTVNKILEKSNITQVDFVSIDVEGHEMAVLRGFNVQKYEPLLLVVEYSTTEQQNELILYMEGQGYASWVNNGQDIFFVQKPALKNWKVSIYGYYQQIMFSKPVQFIVRLVRQLGQ